MTAPTVGGLVNAVVSLARQLVVVRSQVAWHAHVSRDPLARINSPRDAAIPTPSTTRSGGVGS